jgi:hypothetical protein
MKYYLADVQVNEETAACYQGDECDCCFSPIEGDVFSDAGGNVHVGKCCRGLEVGDMGTDVVFTNWER